MRRHICPWRSSDCLTMAEGWMIVFKLGPWYLLEHQKFPSLWLEEALKGGELIQNAEDAGATEVKFLFDETEYGVESLWSPDMEQHQGTALYAYNDAVFTVEDWNGIQEIARSRKRDDPLKVGRFGIGFNSVYHVTDVPSIFSGDQIAMLDPHQTLFGVHESGQCWNMKTDIKEITELSDQFAPYFGIFGILEKNIKEANFPGTLFRFPLRLKPSQLSSNIYNKEKVLELFESFKTDADTVLLFLKSVNKISLHVRESDGTERMLFQVTSAGNAEDKLERPNALKMLGQAVDSYNNGVPSSTITCVTYQVNIDTQDKTAKETQRTTWLVTNGVGGRGMCPELDSLADDLKFMPTIGIALPLTVINKDDEGATSGFSGRAFCFLPLPPGEESETGLPVHVSGFFGLTDNRRSIKWREVDQWRDPAALWNELLLITVIPRAYLMLITEYVQRVQTKKDQDFPLTPTGTYGAWPNPNLVKSRWKPILQPLFHELLQLPVIYSLCEKWVQADEVVFSELDMDEDISKIVINYLQNSGVQVAKVPISVDVVLASYMAEASEVKKVRPPLLRQVIRKNKHKGSSQEKLLLLEFVLSDANYSDLIGLELLPLQDETFTSFSSPVSEKDAIYITSEEYPRTPSAIILVEGEETTSSGILLDIMEKLGGTIMDRLSKQRLSSQVTSLSITEKIALRKYLAGLSDVTEREKHTLLELSIFEKFGTSCEEMCDISHAVLVGSAVALVEHTSAGMKKALKLSLEPQADQVVQHLRAVIDWHKSKAFTTEDWYQFQQILFEIYGFMQTHIQDAKEAMKSLPFDWVWTGKTFSSPGRTVLKPLPDLDLQPYLYSLPKTIRKFNKLFKSCGSIEEVVPSQVLEVINTIQQRCTGELTKDDSKHNILLLLNILRWLYNNQIPVDTDMHVPILFHKDPRILETVKQGCGRRALSEDNFQLCRRVISEGIWSLIRDKSQEYCQENHGGILLPDSNLTLQPSKSLCYNDCPWIKVRDTTVKYCHGDIPREVAVKLGAVPKRHKALERYASNICFTPPGSEFGQKEKLTSRIKSILSAYPSEKEMLKELLQNADDAKATEIFFIYDPRTHPTDRVFDDKWIPMQGPALCVYNNQPFTEDDVRGIQNLGRGTKEANPGKTGQYGIGFNSVYHITDCPSFISNSDILCIFDPHAQYAPGATSASPGRMFRDLDSDFRSQFSDVLNLYLGAHFKLERSTMFRFPIRSTEMAKTSEISSLPASDRMVQNLLDKLKIDGAELLMFLNHMEKISICEIDQSSGQPKVIYSVTARISEGDRLKRKQFHASVIDSVIKKKQLSAIPVQQITYSMDILDTDGNSTTWMICNRSGFPNMENVSKGLVSAHKNEDITLFPRGGVAACVSHNYKKPHRAFCFLPLSLETGLPFHVNGHFALDSARRNLWRDDNGVGVRSDWNNNLMTLLIAPACVELLIQLKRRYFPGPDPTMTILQGTPLHMVKDTLRKYLFFFPANRLDIQPDWYCLVKAVYSCIHSDLKRLLPVVRAAHSENSDMHSVIYILWVNTSTAKKSRAFFDNLLQDELQHLKNAEYNITSRKSVAENVYRLKTLLLDIGFNLIHSCEETANLYTCLEATGIPVSYVTPKDVRNFLYTFSSPDTTCHIGKLPCRIQHSHYKLLHNLKLLVDYCFKDVDVDEVKIEGLPLLITIDNMLQVFDSKRPKFLTLHHELISSRKELFINTLFMRYSNILLKEGIAKNFDISSFGDLLGSVLPREYQTKVPVKWRDTFASESWLKNVWNFISENIAIKEDQLERTLGFDTVADILKDWALLPGTKFMARDKIVVPEHDVLLPLSLMHLAIFPQGQNDKVFHTLMKSGCIQLALNKISVKENPIMPILAQHTANIENPQSILRAVEYMIQASAFKAASLTDKDFEALLLYFNCNLAGLTQQNAQSLKLLPCFKSIGGKYVSIANHGANYVLVRNIPTADMDRWAHNGSFAFLADCPQLKELYTFLGCMPIDDLEIYHHHVLPKFESFCYDAKVEHIVYLKERLLSIEEPCDLVDQLYEKLEGLMFIFDYSNRLRPAKFFYDETVKVFQVMLPSKSFITSDFFKKVEQVSKPKNGALSLASWITFLRNIGLKHQVSQQQVLQFAKEVSIKAQTEGWTKEKVQTTADVLLNHIFNERTDLFQGSFLKELSMIPFLYPERAPKELIKLHSQYQEMSGSLPLIRFSGSQVNPKFKQTDIIHLLWTSCPILPEKATPSSIKEQDGTTLTGQEQLDQVLNILAVTLDPPLEKVISNCKNICNISSPDDEMVKTRNKVLRSTYEFLNGDKRDFRYHLRGVAFVIVEDGWKLLKSEEVVINLDNESDFKPYLYKLPLELGTFHQLFKLLGAEDIVSTKQYTEVLWRIYRNSEGKQLDPNEMRTVKRVVSGFFKSLHNDPVEIRKDLENLRDLTFYLPSHDGKLAKSSSLVFDDAPHYKSRIQGNIGVQMLVDMSQCYLGKDHAFHTKLIMLLPQKLRPRLLSSILEEHLDEDSPKMCQFGALCSLQGRLQLLLSSEQFITGLMRIMKHENENAYIVNEEKSIRLCKALCEGLKVSCFEKLQTTLRIKGCTPIPNSCSETLAFLKRYGTAVIHLYIQHSDSKDINFLLALAMTLKSATDNLISDTSYLIAMLGCNDIYRITEKLDNLGVKYDSAEPSKLELPLPGTPIPAEIHHTLLMDPMNVFYPGEYVGYLVDSEGGDMYGSYQPTYTYAIIVQEVEREEEENSGFLGKCFQIDIGYKNLRPPSQKQSPNKIKLNALPDILKEVTSVVEQAWKRPESERKKIIRRLYLKWHPDKNADNLDIATEKVEEYSTHLIGLSNDVHILEGYGVDGLRTRYPDLLPFPQIPNDRYTSERGTNESTSSADLLWGA
ncbi:Sacsin DnaJ -like protein subfamily C member 29 [Takifugu flavidus]|uniref:Sacsin DnaJ-like protein subfamily C member 29 n=1 Tax=Takifugu flavidus TaxID=433684 RepID=A0A5C6PFV5_9TELE|nr:Sacsin DnaJ -like protein subfamily C member 29 [Takifugu flavidus]